MITKKSLTAKPLASHFVTKKRGRGPKAPFFVSLRDSAPAWLRDAIYDAHMGDGPRDWIYFECEAACLAIDDGALASDDDLHEYADGQVDIYTADRFAWAAEICLSDTMAHAEEALKDMGGHTGTLADQLGALQYCAIENIARTMLDAASTHRPDRR